VVGEVNVVPVKVSERNSWSLSAAVTVNGKGPDGGAVAEKVDRPR